MGGVSYGLIRHAVPWVYPYAAVGRYEYNATMVPGGGFDRSTPTPAHGHASDDAMCMCATDSYLYYLKAIRCTNVSANHQQAEKPSDSQSHSVIQMPVVA